MKESTVMKLITILLASLLIAFFCSCQKYLDVKPTTDLVVPQTLDDYFRLMDNYQIMNSSPILGEVSSDNYYIPDQKTLAVIPQIFHRNAYLFMESFGEGTSVIHDWNYSYKQIFVANLVLTGLNEIPRNDGNADQWDYAKGWASFSRAYAYFNLTQLYSSPYDSRTAATELGVPLRILPGVDEEYQRASLADTYNLIREDMGAAAQILPEGLMVDNRNRPTKEAALGALARIYLSMREYELALETVNSCLDLYDQLLDFNQLKDLPSPYSLPLNHTECLWASMLGANYRIFSRGLMPGLFIDTLLYSSYQNGDLRKTMFFMPSNSYAGKANINWSFGHQTAPFGGLAVDEMYLIKSECLVRTGSVEEGISVLNQLLSTRFEEGEFNPYSESRQAEALEIVLSERRKELVFRGLRWQDIRRLNLEGKGIAIERNFEGQNYRLDPNSNRFALPIPSEEIRLNNLTQNLRN
ncbi:RagB/SusD family nutrient uptake outer membrane protein [Parapedobacter sp. ISTM3]|uniref:RagB/SusD family nutrient uptake outer membrane protein n=1 Tax=Parapedobacter sp. ISTM3 TaxID=2800130 RepID=UPI00190633E8|nr:RagB/SusD family nutrient uptake outer membrane protein [Parapedobacter sp. ISTM3]MBK1439823.1 RagB/SusD family nutrient uptake outer membrane protein [Parapedobacter sp. ISTM3]